MFRRVCIQIKTATSLIRLLRGSQDSRKITVLQTFWKLRKPYLTFGPALLEYSRTEWKSAGPKKAWQTDNAKIHKVDLFELCNWLKKWIPCDILHWFDRLYFAVGQTEPKIWAQKPSKLSRALSDIWTGKTSIRVGPGVSMSDKSDSFRTSGFILCYSYTGGSN